MAREATDAALYEPREGSPNPELLLSAVLHLMSHFTVQNQESGDCARLASVIERHLQALADLPGPSPVLQATCQQLTEPWSRIVERAIAVSGKRKPRFALVTAKHLS